jgi:hypothetical protein
MAETTSYAFCLAKVSGLFGPATSMRTLAAWLMVISSEAANVSKVEVDTKKAH